MKGSARILFSLGLGLFLIGAVVGILDILGIYRIPGLDNPVAGALGLSLVGLSLMMLVRARERFR